MTQSGEPLRVLVAEDEALIRMDLAETLLELGFEVVAAVGDGRSAVAAEDGDAAKECLKIPRRSAWHRMHCEAFAPCRNPSVRPKRIG